MARILVVDDFEVDRRMVETILKSDAGYELRFASSGVEAIEMLRQQLPDIVLTDLYMPKMDGMSLVDHIREHYPRLPVILMTSRGNEEVAVQALERGAASYVPKRLLERYLGSTIRSLMAVVGENQTRDRLLGSMRSNSCTFVLGNDIELVPSLVTFLKESMSHMGLCAEPDLLRASVALEEALTNAIHHGNLGVSSELRERDDNAYFHLIRQRQNESPYKDREVRVRVRMNDSEAVFLISDEGDGFDATKLPNALDAENLERAGGRGIVLMRTFMDEVIFNEKGNQVTMIKNSSEVNGEVSKSPLFDAEFVKDVGVLTLRRDCMGLCDGNLSREVDALLIRIRDNQSHGVVIDMMNIAKFGSAFLEALRRIWNVVRSVGGRMVLCGVSDLGMEIIQLARFDSVWEIHPTRESAISAVSRS